MFTKEQVDEIIDWLAGGRDARAVDVPENIHDFLEEYVYPFDNNVLDDVLTEQKEWMTSEDIQHFIARIARELDVEYVSDEDSKNGVFLIFDSWSNKIGPFQEAWNRKHHPLPYMIHRQKYLRAGGQVGEHPFESMRLDIYGNHPASGNSKSPYLILDGLEELDDICDYGFSDEYTVCSNCYQTLIKRSPDHYGWQSDYWSSEQHGYICRYCINDDPDDYIEHCTNNPDMCINTSLVDIGKLGWIRIDMNYENGLHHGMNSDPKSVLKALNRIGVDCIFETQPSQFYTTFWPWVPSLGTINSDPEKFQTITSLFTNDSKDGDDTWTNWLMEYLESASTDLPYDKADEFAKVLRGEHSDYVTKHTYKITADEFISGKWKQGE